MVSIETEDIMIEVYHIKSNRIVGTSLYTRTDLIDIFGKRAALRILDGKTYTNRKQKITRMTKKTWNRRTQ